MPHVHATQLTASRQRWYTLARVEQTLRIPGIFQSEKLLEFRAAELNAHLIEFLYADTMLTRDRPSRMHTRLEDHAAKTLGGFQLTGFIGIKQNQGM